MVEQRINSEVKIKVLNEPMNNPLGVSPSKENQGTTRGQKIFSLPRVVPSFSLLWLKPGGLFMGSFST